MEKSCRAARGEAMTQTERFGSIGINMTTGREAVAEMLEAGAIERIGKGGVGEPYRYFKHEK